MRIRRKVKDVLPCDVTKPRLLLPEDIGQFDVVTTELVLESGCETFDAFSDAIKCISQLVRPGGRFIIVSIYGTTHYMVGDKAFFALPITNQFVGKVLAENGFKDISNYTKDIVSIMGVDTAGIFHAYK